MKQGLLTEMKDIGEDLLAKLEKLQASTDNEKGEDGTSNDQLLQPVLQEKLVSGKKGSDTLNEVSELEGGITTFNAKHVRKLSPKPEKPRRRNLLARCEAV